MKITAAAVAFKLKLRLFYKSEFFYLSKLNITDIVKLHTKQEVAEPWKSDMQNSPNSKH